MRLTVVLCTYNRTDYALSTLRAILENLQWQDQLHVHIADDGSRAGHVDVLYKVASERCPVTTSNAARGGYGKNYNLAMAVVRDQSDYILPLEDDWVLSRPLNVDDLVLDMTEGKMGCVRLGYVGYTQELRGIFRYVRNHHYIELDPDSPEPHVFAGHPRLVTPAWDKTVGMWPEGIAAGYTEMNVAHHEGARKSVFWPISLIPLEGGLFQHIGSVKA